MAKRLLRDPLLIFLIITAVVIKLFTCSPSLVERYYSNGFYVYSSWFFRAIFGWIPFSMGDILYLLAGTWLAFKAGRLVFLLIRRRIREKLTVSTLSKYVKIALWVYVLFHLCWGLNYYRQGIAAQLELNPAPYSVEEVVCLVEKLWKGLEKFRDLGEEQ